jgi:hypothetical protein
MEVWFLLVWLSMRGPPVVMSEQPSKHECELIAVTSYPEKRWKCRMALRI